MALDRFINAQEEDYEEALKEIKNGQKRSHWIWYVFPQLKGLGYSYNAQYYGIDDLNEAKAYLDHPLLRNNLIEITQAFYDLNKSAESVFGHIDALKVRSCMTLFYHADSSVSLFKEVIDKYYHGQWDQKTEELLS